MEHSNTFDFNKEIVEANEALVLLRNKILSDLEDCERTLHSIKMLPANESLSGTAGKLIRGSLNTIAALITPLVRIPKIFKSFKIGELEDWKQKHRVSYSTICNKTDEFFVRREVFVPKLFTTDGTTLMGATQLLTNELQNIDIITKVKNLKVLVGSLEKMIKNSNAIVPVLDLLPEPNVKGNDQILNTFESPKGYKDSAPFGAVFSGAKEVGLLNNLTIESGNKYFSTSIDATRLLDKMEPTIRNVVNNIAESDKVGTEFIDTLIKVLRTLGVYTTFNAQYVLYLHKVEHNMYLNMIEWNKQL